MREFIPNRGRNQDTPVHPGQYVDSFYKNQVNLESCPKRQPPFLEPKPAVRFAVALQIFQSVLQLDPRAP